MTTEQMLRSLGLPTYEDVVENGGHQQTLRTTRKTIVESNDRETLAACLGDDVAALKDRANYSGEAIKRA